MILNFKSLLQKVKKVKFEKLNSTILQSPIFMSITVVLRKLGQASPRQLEYADATGMQIQAPLKSPRRAYGETQGLQPATRIFSAKV